jgi:hypothetical protein
MNLISYIEPMDGTIRRTVLFIDINLSFYNRNYLWSQRLIDKSSKRLLVLMDHFCWPGSPEFCSISAPFKPALPLTINTASMLTEEFEGGSFHFDERGPETTGSVDELPGE